MAASGNIKKVIIVGAGPSGLLLAIMLANHGIHVQVLEGSDKLDSNPRAAHYAPSAVYDFHRAGIADKVNAQGFFPDGVCWRNFDGSFIAGSDWKDREYPMVVLPLDRLLPLFLEHLLTLPSAEVFFEHRVIGIEHGENEAKVKVKTSEGEKFMAAEYVIGADGADSQIRRSLFGDRNYPGETLPHQIIATNVYFNFQEKYDYWHSNFILHPTNWYMAAQLTADGMWRLTYGDVYGLSREEYLKRLPQRYAEILPGHPQPDEYKIVAASPYKLQQRCAPSLRVGRFLLVADAGHLCNPFGGLGLTGGFADVGSLYDCFLGIHKGVADDSILDKYSEIRIKIWREMIDPQSRENFNRLWSEEAAERRDQFLGFLKRATEDAEFREKNTPDMQAIRHDFTQYWKKAPDAAT